MVTTHGKLCGECKLDRAREDAERRARPKPMPRPRWRDLTDAERVQLTDADPDKLAELIPRLQLDRVPSIQIGAVLGLDRRQMSKLWPRPERQN